MIKGVDKLKICEINLARVYTCKFDNQVPNRKLVKKLFFVVKFAQYFVCEEDRKLASYCKQEILILKLGKLFSQTSVFVPSRQTFTYKRGIRLVHN